MRKASAIIKIPLKTHFWIKQCVDPLWSGPDDLIGNGCNQTRVGLMESMWNFKCINCSAPWQRTNRRRKTDYLFLHQQQEDNHLPNFNGFFSVSGLRTLVEWIASSCCGFLQWINKTSKSANFSFAPLQGAQIDKSALRLHRNSYVEFSSIEIHTMNALQDFFFSSICLASIVRLHFVRGMNVGKVYFSSNSGHAVVDGGENQHDVRVCTQHVNAQLKLKHTCEFVWKKLHQDKEYFWSLLKLSLLSPLLYSSRPFPFVVTGCAPLYLTRLTQCVFANLFVANFFVVRCERVDVPDFNTFARGANHCLQMPADALSVQTNFFL